MVQVTKNEWNRTFIIEMTKSMNGRSEHNWILLVFKQARD